MSADQLALAHERARRVVGNSVWAKLSEKARAAAIREEMRTIVPSELAISRKPSDVSAKKTTGASSRTP